MDAEQLPTLQIARYIVLLNASPNLFLREFSKVPKQSGALETEKRLSLEHVLSLTTSYEATAASRGSETYPLGFEQYDVKTAFRQIERGRQPGEATADDANIRLTVTVQNGIVAHTNGGRGVVAIRVSVHFAHMDDCGLIGVPSKKRLRRSADKSMPVEAPVSIPAIALPAPGPRPKPCPLNPVAT